ncbi:tetratricopeptide repeat protein [Nonomuraea sp. NPDC050451]|uniref:tetratricopeptide repeat protein n=1 Tax=Nonomuraea sp. NPDC050451 TaxID=3364364 RepID=UPI00378F9985
MDPSTAREHLAGMIQSGEAAVVVLAEAEKFLKEFDWHVGLVSDVGSYASNEGVFDMAIRCFEAAIDLEPDNPLHHYDLGVVLQRCDEHARARRSLEQAVMLLPYYTDALVNLCYAYLVTDDLVAAYFASVRVMALYADQPRPENVQLLLSLIGEWLRSDRQERSALLTAALGPLNEGDLDLAYERMTALAAGLDPGSAGRAISEEFAATIGFHLDRHTEYLMGARERRETVPCAQAFIPPLAVRILEAGMHKDVNKLCHELVRQVDPGHIAEGPVTNERGLDKKGETARVFSVLGTDGFYRLTPIGNVVDVRTPAGEIHRFIDYTGAYNAFYES